MKRVLPLFFLAMSLPLCAQTTKQYTAYGYGLCQNTAPIQQALYCTTTLYRGSTFQGYFTFYLVNNYTSTVSSGDIWMTNASDVTTGTANVVQGKIDTANYMVNFTFSDTLTGNASLGYKIQPGFCNRYCHPPRVVITTGIVTIP